MKIKEKKNNIVLVLKKEEALVLFDWISRFNESSNNEFEDSSEERLFWDMEALLEKSIPQVLSDSYKEILTKARDKIRDKES